MAKKDDERESRLLDIIEKNTEVMCTVFDLLTRLTQSRTQSKPETEVAPKTVKDVENPADTESETKTKPKSKTPPKEDKKITPEYCRKAINKVANLIGDEEARAFLASFDGAESIPLLKEEHYPAFIEGAAKIVRENS